MLHGRQMSIVDARFVSDNKCQSNVSLYANSGSCCCTIPTENNIQYAQLNLSWTQFLLRFKTTRYVKTVSYPEWFIRHNGQLANSQMYRMPSCLKRKKIFQILLLHNKLFKCQKPGLLGKLLTITWLFLMWENIKADLNITCTNGLGPVCMYVCYMLSSCFQLKRTLGINDLRNVLPLTALLRSCKLRTIASRIKRDKPIFLREL